MIENARRMDLRGNRLWLLPQRALYWQKKKMLLVADLHIGKSGHFRKHGIPVPGTVNRANLEQLDQLIEQLAIQHLVILGDLFHSGENREWDQFDRWRKNIYRLSCHWFWATMISYQNPFIMPPASICLKNLRQIRF
ncbi:MAG: hypothetical protein R3211_07375 [Balneolaceae bacterium]|nr:hypothetical protein [Balneolaceae bacterium]